MEMNLKKKSTKNSYLISTKETKSSKKHNIPIINLDFVKESLKQEEN